VVITEGSRSEGRDALHGLSKSEAQEVSVGRARLSLGENTGDGGHR
jgi:hypothetical protein